MSSCNSEKAKLIWRGSYDGDSLTQEQLKIVRHVRAGQGLNDEEQRELDALHATMLARLGPPWFHGIENLTQDCQNYVYWKGVSVEHYSFHGDVEAEKDAATKLAQSCLRAESRGFPVNVRTINDEGPFADAPAGTPWFDALSSYYAVFAEGGKAKWLILYTPDLTGVALSGTDGEVRVHRETNDKRIWALYHWCKRNGLSDLRDRLSSYASFVECMQEAGITPEVVRKVLSGDVGQQQRPLATA